MAEHASGGKHTNHLNHRTPMARMITDRESAVLHLSTARRPSALPAATAVTASSPL